MKAEELVNRIIADGGDEEGIMDRFGDNAELYLSCFTDFLDEPDFEKLGRAIANEEYDSAFEAAHALKGLSGNLGLTVFYKAICLLVESLRAKRYDDVSLQYAAVMRRRGELAVMAAGTHDVMGSPFATKADINGPVDEGRPGKAEPSDPEKASRRQMFISIGVVTVAFIVVALLFGLMGINFKDSIVEESSRHLSETSNQIRLYIEERIQNDWRIARSVGDSIVQNADGYSEAAVKEMLQKRRALWGVSDLMLYTEDGHCIYSDGTTVMNDIASDAIDKARKQGQYMTIVDSTVTYTVPVDTDACFNDSRIAAVAAVRDMRTLLDDMNITSFDSEAWAYLTDENGMVISMLSSSSATRAFNFKAIVRDMNILPLYRDGTPEELFAAQDTAAFLIGDSEADNYCIAAPVSTGTTPLRLYYLAPESVVNSQMNGFSQKLTMFSLAMISLFGIMAFVIFMSMYRNRRRLFDKAIVARERMFDLLVKNTRTAFALFTANGPEPEYISSNATDVIGDSFWSINKTDTGYIMTSSDGSENETIRQVNESLGDWDGNSPFKSGYIRNWLAAEPSYFEFELYPTDAAGTDLIGIAKDVTEAYKREEATRSAMELATRANEAKSRFLSNVSHDIRTPMNAIMNVTNFALESIDQPKKLGPYLRTIRESSEHLLHLINDVLDMSRIESGQTVVASAPFDIRAEVQRQVDMVKPLCTAKGLTLIADFAGLTTPSVCGDAIKLSQIVMNLLSNAVKFTPDKGAVRLTAAEIPSLRDDIVDVRFTVEDNGIGISQEDMPYIFDPFCRANDKHVGGIEGTGLGLSICKSYVDAMGGTIRCESEEGEGSVFTVELFFRRADGESGTGTESAVKSAELGDAPFLGLRCLVAEDNRINRLIAKTLLERAGFIVDFAGDGAECVVQFLEAKQDTYDVIYLDIQMPVMDGYKTAEKIRSSGHPRADSIPIVAMTANASAEDIERARVAGMDAYIGKPIVSFDLVDQTIRAINKKKGHIK